MSRRLSDRMLEVMPQRIFHAIPADNEDGWGTIEQARAAYFKPGDLVAVETAHGPRRALVLFATWARNEARAEYGLLYIPLYKVRLANADSSLGRGWRWAYPGDIERGLAALAEAGETKTAPSADHGAVQ